jgi:hypothetical protein
MITDEQFDKFEVGDFIVTAFTVGDGDDSWEIREGVIREKDGDCPLVFSKYYTLHPNDKRHVLIEHKPKPKPAWHTAKVILIGETYLVRNPDGDNWVDGYNQTVSTHYLGQVFSLEKIEVVVP